MKDSDGSRPARVEPVFLIRLFFPSLAILPGKERFGHQGGTPMIYTWIGCALLGLLVFVFFSPIVIHFRFHRYEERDHIDLRVRLLYGLFRFHLEIPLLQWQGNQIIWKNQLETNVQPSEFEAKEKVQLSDWLRTLKELPLQRLYRTACRILRRVHLTRFSWRTSFGAGDAASTAVLSGCLWTLKSLLANWLQRHLRVKSRYDYQIFPRFQEAYFETDLDCILTLRLGYAMFMGLWLIFMFRGQLGKGREGKRPWQNTLYRA